MDDLTALRKYSTYWYTNDYSFPVIYEAVDYDQEENCFILREVETESQRLADGYYAVPIPGKYAFLSDQPWRQPHSYHEEYMVLTKCEAQDLEEVKKIYSGYHDRDVDCGAYIAYYSEIRKEVVPFHDQRNRVFPLLGRTGVLEEPFSADKEDDYDDDEPEELQEDEGDDREIYVLAPKGFIDAPRFIRKGSKPHTYEILKTDYVDSSAPFGSYRGYYVYKLLPTDAVEAVVPEDKIDPKRIQKWDNRPVDYTIDTTD